MYATHYETSRAVVIGINDYASVSPLGHARQDAEQFAKALETRLGFSEEHIELLVDSEATKSRIMSAFMRLANEEVDENDRVIVFFAGHGDTRKGRRGEVGHLIPVDGDPDDLATLIRWDDLTRNAELISAKHLLFIMDACYGGLAVQRALAPGSMRFVKDMLQRYSRQVLTAGKADETVADAGGPRPGHSMFTGHMLDALDGKAAGDDGILTANTVMAYVYDRVSRDVNSTQTPHYGFIEGDGDMILVAPGISEPASSETVETDVLVQVPGDLAAPLQEDPDQNLVDTVKEYLSEAKYRIRLSDLADKELRKVLHATREDALPTSPERSDNQEFASRLGIYDHEMTSILSVVVLTAHWGSAEHRPVLERTIARLADNIEHKGGLTFWLGFRWYPLQMTMYAGGIAALASNDYKNLHTLLMTSVGDRQTGSGSAPAIIPTVEGILGVERANAFKSLPGHERNYAPRSEYMFKVLQPHLEDLLFLGSAYEDLFDRFEILFALSYADVSEETAGHLWGPPGRFGWKHKRGYGRSPYDELLEEHSRLGDEWPILTSGFFRGSGKRFADVASRFRDELLNKLPWH